MGAVSRPAFRGSQAQGETIRKTEMGERAAVRESSSGREKIEVAGQRLAHKRIREGGGDGEIENEII